MYSKLKKKKLKSKKKKKKKFKPRLKPNNGLTFSGICIFHITRFVHS